MSLATKYRPREFEDVCGQGSVIKILRRQIEVGDISNCYLFCGPSGTGKTTLARIFASKINGGLGTPIEIDGASNNGVDNVRGIIESAKERALDATYKTYVIDECHAITSQGWQAFLKCIEEPPKYTVFIFCTTDPQKVPATIQNRVMRFNLAKIPASEIRARLEEICKTEGFLNYKDACDYISKLSDGGMRDAIATLEKCSKYSADLSLANAMEVLDGASYKDYAALTNAILDKDDKVIVGIVDAYYNKGKDMRIFMDGYLDFTLDLTKYCVFRDMGVTKLPDSFEKDVRYITGADQGDNSRFFKALANKVLALRNAVAKDSNARATIQVTLLNLGDK